MCMDMSLGKGVNDYFKIKVIFFVVNTGKKILLSINQI